MDEKEYKEALLGSTQKPINDGGHLVNFAKVFAPFTQTDSITRVFCTGCGSYVEVSQEEAIPLLTEIDQKVDNYAGTHLQVEGCIVCGNKFEKVSLHSHE